MNKLKVCLFFVFFIIFMPLINVEAARELCTSKALNEMKTKAYKINLSYELKFDEAGSPYFSVSINNIQEGTEVRFDDVVYEYDANTTSQTIATALEGGTTYEFEIYSSYGYPCTGEILYTKKLALPKYNKYSEWEECIEYEEFPLCKKYYSGNIENDEYFYKKLNEYKNSLKQDTIPNEKLSEKNFFESIIGLYIDNLSITLPLTIVLLGLLIIFIAKKIIDRKKRIKIKI